jgi:uncharacterized BrkB/YihY/UPF0761 family membrane protein
MMNKRVVWRALRPVLRFLARFLADFRRNYGLLLAGAVAYYTLLSLVPLFALFLLILSYLVDTEQVLHTVTVNLEFLVPGQARAIADDVVGLLRHQQLIGGVGVAALLFFSSMAFTVLENAMAAIFHHRAPRRPRRHPVV